MASTTDTATPSDATADNNMMIVEHTDVQIDKNKADDEVIVNTDDKAETNTITDIDKAQEPSLSSVEKTNTVIVPLQPVENKKLDTPKTYSKRKRKPTVKNSESNTILFDKNSNTTTNEDSNNAYYNIVQGSQKYPRRPRLISELLSESSAVIVTSLNKVEIKRDIRDIESSFPPHVFEEDYENENDEDDEDSYTMIPSSSSHKLQPEEAIATMPACRLAVSLTKKELAKVLNERQELELNYHHTRCSLLYQLECLEKQNQRQGLVLQSLASSVTTASNLVQSRKRRNSSLQNLLVELETRGNTIKALEETIEAFKTNNDTSIPSSLNNDTSKISGEDFYIKANEWLSASEELSLRENTSTSTTNSMMIDVKSSTLKSTPSNVPLLLSPLSTLPDFVAGTASTSANSQVFESVLPSDRGLEALEKESLKNAALLGDIKRLEYQLKMAMEEKAEANRQVADQMDAINHLVLELQKARGTENMSNDTTEDVKLQMKMAWDYAEKEKELGKDLVKGEEKSRTLRSGKGAVNGDSNKEESVDDDINDTPAPSRRGRKKKGSKGRPPKVKPSADTNASTTTNTTTSSNNNGGEKTSAAPVGRPRRKRSRLD